MKISTLLERMKDKISEIYAEKKDNYRFRALGYTRAATYIADNYAVDETVTPKLVAGMNLTPYMKQKVLSFRTSKPNPALQLKKRLMEIKGIGAEKAQALITAGLKTVSQLKTQKWLNQLSDEARIHVLYKPQPIERAYIANLETKVKKLGYNTHFVGSYRRRKPVSNDVDIMLISDDASVLKKFLADFSKVVKAYPYSQGIDKLSTVVDDGKRYKVDVFRVDPEYAIPMLLYSTGSKENNIRMRHAAKEKNYLLNQKGLFDRKTGKALPLKSERAYYEALSLPYLEPWER